MRRGCERLVGLAHGLAYHLLRLIIRLAHHLLIHAPVAAARHAARGRPGAFAVPLALEKVALILVLLLRLQRAHAVHPVLLELALVPRARRPQELALAFAHPLAPRAHIHILIAVGQGALAAPLIILPLLHAPPSHAPTCLSTLSLSLSLSLTHTHTNTRKHGVHGARPHCRLISACR